MAEVVSYVAADDVGIVINAQLLEGELHGWKQPQDDEPSTGQTRFVSDSSGQLLTAAFLDYGMPRASPICRKSCPSPMWCEPPPTRSV